VVDAIPVGRIERDLDGVAVGHGGFLHPDWVGSLERDGVECVEMEDYILRWCGFLLARSEQLLVVDTLAISPWRVQI
jgi:hypothetical protein